MWGRIVGTLIGFAVFNFLGAFIGYLIGQLIDRQGASALTAGMDRVGGDAARRPAQNLFMELLFTALGDIAKSDGRISEQEVAHTEAIITRLGLNEDQRQQAIAWFKQGAQSDYDYQSLLMAFSRASRFRPDLKKVLLEILISLAFVDGKLDVNERRILERIALGIGIPAQVFDKLLELIQAQMNFAGAGAGQANINSADMLSDAYQALGVSSTASDKEVKTAYRKLMSEHHPDKLMSRGVPDHVIKLATEKSQAIQQAYDLIKKHRKATTQAA